MNDKIHSQKGSITQEVSANGITRFTLTNANGMSMSFLTFGGIITSLTAPNRDGKYENVIIGLQPEEYFKGNPDYFGALIGRYGNRICKGQFTLEGQQYQLPVNNGPNHLHGGEGFDRKIWHATIINEDNPTIKLAYTSKDGEEGYPGNLNVEVTYHLRDDNALKITYEAKTDRKTIINLTQHSYFNLSGNFNNFILDHELQINADVFLPIDENSIPTGEEMPVENSPFDFRTLRKIGEHIDLPSSQLQNGSGYDHCFIINEDGEKFKKVAVVRHTESGRVMEVLSDQPGIQFYSGNFIDGTKQNPDGHYFQKRCGLCLETQHFPDSPNRPEFPSVVLNVGETFNSKTVYKFDVD